MVLISHRETNRLFGPSNRPEFNTNVRHRAVLRKALELFPVQELEAIFERPTKYMHNYRLVSRETPPPDLEARQALRAYRDAYDAYFMKQGNDYAVRDAAAKAVLQAAEQTWHDWIVRYLAMRGRPGRPQWALEPLPGIRRVRTAPLPAPRAVSPARAPRHTPFAPLTPPSSAPIPVGSRLRPITISDDEAMRPPPKRKLLEVVDISDDEKVEAVRTPKKLKFLGVIDLTI